MITLGIETSCDETAVAILDGEHGILANLIYSQVDLHARYGGVVPELASRDHLKKLPYLAEEALREAGTEWGEIGLVGATYGPGLIGPLVVGVSYAKGLCVALDVPLVGVHHLAAHLFAHRLSHPDVTPPFLGLIVSGGHTELVVVKGWDDFRVVGTIQNGRLQPLAGDGSRRRPHSARRPGHRTDADHRGRRGPRACWRLPERRNPWGQRAPLRGHHRGPPRGLRRLRAHNRPGHHRQRGGLSLQYRPHRQPVLPEHRHPPRAPAPRVHHHRQHHGWGWGGRFHHSHQLERHPGHGDQRGGRGTGRHLQLVGRTPSHPGRGHRGPGERKSLPSPAVGRGNRVHGRPRPDPGRSPVGTLAIGPGGA